jgi:hypothetical protein
MNNLENKDTNLKIFNLILKINFLLTVSVGWEYIHFGSVQFGQFLHRIFLIATLLSKISFFSSSDIFSKANFSFKLLLFSILSPFFLVFLKNFF